MIEKQRYLMNGRVMYLSANSDEIANLESLD